MIGFLIFLFITGLVLYYPLVLFKFFNDDFNTKKEFLLALIPFWFWVTSIKEKYSELQ